MPSTKTKTPPAKKKAPARKPAAGTKAPATEGRARRPPEPAPAAARVLVLRTCNPDRISTNGFRWPESGPVAAPDWRPTKECGHGLHGFAWGEGDGQLANWDSDAKWLVVAVDPATIVDLGGKVKFPRGEVVFCGDRAAATAYLTEHGAAGRAIVGGT